MKAPFPVPAKAPAGGFTASHNLVKRIDIKARTRSLVDSTAPVFYRDEHQDTGISGNRVCFRCRYPQESDIAAQGDRLDSGKDLGIKGHAIEQDKRRRPP